MTKSFLNSEEIKLLIPHRYPFLFIDKILSIIPGSEIIALKNLSINENIFSGHFPSEAIFPGVLAVEASAQAAGVLCAYSNLLQINNISFDEDKVLNSTDLVPNLSLLKKNDKSLDQQIFYLTTIDETKFKKPMLPGASLFIKIKVLQKRSIMWKFYSEIFIDNDELAVISTFSAFLKQK